MAASTISMFTSRLREAREANAERKAKTDPAAHAIAANRPPSELKKPGIAVSQLRTRNSPQIAVSQIWMRSRNRANGDASS